MSGWCSKRVASFRRHSFLYVHTLAEAAVMAITTPSEMHTQHDPQKVLVKACAHEVVALA